MTCYRGRGVAGTGLAGDWEALDGYTTHRRHIIASALKTAGPAYDLMESGKFA